jgi:exoribonuclease R
LSFDNFSSDDSRAPGLPTRKLTGRIKIHPAGYGFVVPDDKSEDVHVSARNRGAAMDADTVEIEA